MRMVGKLGQGGVSLRLNEAEVKRYVLSSIVTFQEILLIRIYIMKAQDKGNL